MHRQTTVPAPADLNETTQPTDPLVQQAVDALRGMNRHQRRAWLASQRKFVKKSTKAKR